MRSIRTVAVAGLLALGSSACASHAGVVTAEDSSASTATAGDNGQPIRVGDSRGAPEDTRGESDFEHPPPVTLHTNTGSVVVSAYSYCYVTLCADGFPPEDPPSVGSPGTVTIDFPLDGWSFVASFTPARSRCGRIQTVPVRPTAEGTLVLPVAGHADTYDVTLFGRGEGGDLATVFRWSTPSDGALASPESRLAVVAGQGPELDSYGVELAVSNLASTPDEAEATVTVTAANGGYVTFEAARAKGRCQPEGSVFWDGPDAEGLKAANLGPPPFTYRVVLVIDGTAHVATARWPADVIRGDEPSVALTFAPKLPGPT